MMTIIIAGPPEPVQSHYRRARKLPLKEQGGTGVISPG